MSFAHVVSPSGYQANVLWVAGTSSRCASLLLAGSGGVSVANTTGFPAGSDARSSAAWLRIGAGLFTGTVFNYGSDANSRWQMRVIASANSNTTTFYVDGGSDGGDAVTSEYVEPGINTTAWRHFAATYPANGNASAIALYIDGAAVATTVLNPAAVPNTVADAARVGYLATGSPGSADDFDGNLRDVRLYNRELSAGDVTAVYNGGCPTDDATLSNGVVLRYRLSQAAGTTTADTGPNAITGTLTGTAAWSADCPCPGDVDPDPGGGGTHSLDATAGNATASDTGLPSGTSAYRVEFYAKCLSGMSGYHAAVVWGSLGVNNAVSAVFAFNGGWYAGTWGPSLTGPAVAAGAWVPVALSHDGAGNYTLAVGGTPASGSMATNVVIDGSGLRVGGAGVSPFNPYADMHISGLKIWDNAAGTGTPVRDYTLNNTVAESNGGPALSGATFVADHP